MLTNLQQLPAWVWALAIFVVIVASIIVIWIRRNYKLGKIKFKSSLAEVELDRKPSKESTPNTQTHTPAQPLRTQDMTRSEDGEQSMHGKGGVQKQEMTDSPRGKQTMD